MGIAHPQASAYVQERRKWEIRPVMDGDTMLMPIPLSEGGKANQPYQEFPKMLFRAESADGGPRITGELIVHSAQEEANAKSRGWCEGQQAAIDAIFAQQREFATLAANRNYNDRLMSEAAKAESQAFEETASGHVPVIPEAPIKKRGRPVTVATD